MDKRKRLKYNTSTSSPGRFSLAPKPGKSALGMRLTIRVDAYNLKTEKESLFSKKISGYEWTGPYLRNHTKKHCDVAVREYLD